MTRIVQFVAALLITWLLIQWLPLDSITPGPRPGPVDPADPEPTFDGYEEKVFEYCMAVNSRTRKKDCERLAADVADIILRIDSGKKDSIDSNQDVVNELARALKKLPSAWYGQIREIADKVLRPLTQDGSLSTTSRWKKLLQVINPGIIRAGAESTGTQGG